MTVELLDRVTAENFNPTAYLLANPDISAVGCDPADHFATYGHLEMRHQLNVELLDPNSSYRRRKFERFAHCIDPAALADATRTFPLRVGQDHFSLDQYESESANSDYGPFTKAILANPSGLYLDLGCGLRARMHENCLYTEVYASVSADVIVPSDCSYPFMDASFDGIGCFAVLEHTRMPWKVASEIYRMLKPGGKIWIDWPFLQPVHGYPSHYFNATREGLASLFSDVGFDVLEVDTEPHQGFDYTIAWILGALLGALPEPTRRKLQGMTLDDILQNAPSSPFWVDIVGQVDPAVRSMLACGNCLSATKRA